MILTDIGMIASDTSRSRAYLQALRRNDLLPNFVIVLEKATPGSLPGKMIAGTETCSYGLADSDACWSESHFDAGRSIIDDLDEAGIQYEILDTHDINQEIVVDFVGNRPESTLIYSGVGGVLLRKDILATGKNFLHVHGGYLPDFKGSTTNYYSLLMDGSMGASSLFLVEEIDSGPVLLRRKFPPPQNLREIDHIYDSAARAKVLIETLQEYIRGGAWPCELKENIGGDVYYIIHPVLKHLSILNKSWRDACE